jgi:hypothetical protein
MGNSKVYVDESTLQVQFRSEYGIVYTRLQDIRDLRFSRGYSEKILSIAASKGCKKLLIDGRGLDFRAASKENFESLIRLFNLGLDRSLSRALLFDVELDDLLIYETVARKLGFNVKLFREQGAALAWLNGQDYEATPENLKRFYNTMPVLSAGHP